MAIYTVKELIKSETPLCLSITTNRATDGLAGLCRIGRAMKRGLHVLLTRSARDSPDHPRSSHMVDEQDDDACAGFGAGRGTD